MQLLRCVALTLLCSVPVLSTELPPKCDATQYAWPVDAARLCCKKCSPGQYMLRRPEDTCGIQCNSCEGNRYIDSYNVHMKCSICDSCGKANMEYKSRCNGTHNAVCRCKAGFTCRDHPCKQCVPLQSTTTGAPSRAVSTSEPLPRKTIADAVWFLVAIALLCVGIAAVVVTKIKPLLRWARTRHAALPCSEEDEVSKPVQEVCGKCDQPIDL